MTSGKKCLLFCRFIYTPREYFFRYFSIPKEKNLTERFFITFLRLFFLVDGNVNNSPNKLDS